MISGIAEAFNSQQRQLVYSEQGYTTNINVPPPELDSIRAAINEQWLYRIQIADPSVVSKISKNKGHLEKRDFS